ncbi:MAG: AAA family ATPase, partial [Actinomycetota bacterium]|nr:AAA family ATPase [Actinomycetota bacterium]
MTAAEVDEQEPAAAENAPDEDAGKQEKQEKPAEAGWDGAEEFRNLRRTFTVQNNIYGGVHAEHGVFGIGFGETLSSAASGPLDATRVAETLRCFVPPPARQAAMSLLRQHHFVVLVGPEGIGKRALALHLLRAVCGQDAPLEAASP